MTTTDPLTRADLAADFRKAAAGLTQPADVRLSVDPDTARHVADIVAELIAAGDVHAATMVVTA